MEGTETAVAFPNSRDSTKEPITSLPKNRLIKKFGAGAKLRIVLQEKNRGRGASSCRFDRRFGKENRKRWAVQHGWGERKVPVQHPRLVFEPCEWIAAFAVLLYCSCCVRVHQLLFRVLRAAASAGANGYDRKYGTSVSSVRPRQNTRGYGYALSKMTWCGCRCGYKIRIPTRILCEFCKTSIPVPGTCVSSVRLPYPYPELV